MTIYTRGNFTHLSLDFELFTTVSINALPSPIAIEMKVIARV